MRSRWALGWATICTLASLAFYAFYLANEAGIPRPPWTALSAVWFWGAWLWNHD